MNNGCDIFTNLQCSPFFIFEYEQHFVRGIFHDCVFEYICDSPVVTGQFFRRIQKVEVTKQSSVKIKVFINYNVYTKQNFKP